MGVDYDSKLVIGFGLDEDKINDWMSKNHIDSVDEINEILEKLYSDIPKKENSKSLSLYVIKAGNVYSDYTEYYLTFFNCETNIGCIKNIKEEHLEMAKKIYKLIIEKELECEKVDDINVFSVSYIW